jgi:hypothetical protein
MNGLLIAVLVQAVLLETASIGPGPSGGVVGIRAATVDPSGNGTALSKGPVVAGLPSRRAAWTALNVPLVKGARERCGQAALAMVLRYYGADATALREVDCVYDPVLRGSRIADLAGAARRAGYDADVATLTPDSLIDLLDEGVPPILLYESGSGLGTLRHFGVLTEWDAGHASFTLNDGMARRRVARHDLVKRWKTAGSQALIIRERLP